MKKFSFLPVLALVLAIGASAFTTAKNTTSDLVWFKLDPNTGQIINMSGGQQSASDPFSCNTTNPAPCSVALSIDEGEVTENNGAFSVATGTDYTDPAVYNDRHYEQQP